MSVDGQDTKKGWEIEVSLPPFNLGEDLRRPYVAPIEFRAHLGDEEAPSRLFAHIDFIVGHATPDEVEELLDFTDASITGIRAFIPSKDDDVLRRFDAVSQGGQWMLIPRDEILFCDKTMAVADLPPEPRLPEVELFIKALCLTALNSLRQDPIGFEQICHACRAIIRAPLMTPTPDAYPIGTTQ